MSTSRELTEEERGLLVSTLELMRTGHHEPLGPFLDTDGDVLFPKQVPTPSDPDSFLAQIPKLRVKEEQRCAQDCFGCNRSRERRPCGTVFFVSDEERRAFKETVNGGSGWVVAEQAVGGLLVLVFANHGQLAEMEMC